MQTRGNATGRSVEPGPHAPQTVAAGRVPGGCLCALFSLFPLCVSEAERFPRDARPAATVLRVEPGPGGRESPPYDRPMSSEVKPERPSKPKKKRGFVRRWSKRLLYLALLAVPLYLIVGFYVLPWAVVNFGLPVASKFVDGRIELDDLDLDPLSFTATVRGLRVYDQDDVKVLGVKRVRTGVSRRSLWLDDALSLDAVVVEGPYANIVLREDGTLNLGDVFVAPEDDAEPSTEPLDLTWLPRLKLGGLQVTDGVFKFEDRLNPGARPRRVTLSTLTVGPIDTGSDAATPLDAALRSDLGEAAAADGSLTLSPLKLSGGARASGLRLDAYQPYFDRFVPLTLKSGVAGAALSWELDLTPDARRAMARVERVEVTGFRLEDPAAAGAGRPNPPSLVGFERFTLANASLNALAHRVVVGEVRLDGADLTVERAADGTLPLVTAVNESVRRVEAFAAGDPDAEPEPEETPAEALWPLLPPPLDEAVNGLRALLADVTSAEEPWTVGVTTAELAGARARWSDAVPEGGATLGLSPIDASAGPLDTAEELRVPFKATLRVAETSEATAAATPAPAGAEVPPSGAGGGPAPSSSSSSAAAAPGGGEAAARIRGQIAEAADAAGQAGLDLGRGLITAQGTAWLDDPRAELELVIRGLDLTGVNPYLPEAVPGLKLLSSSIDLHMSPRLRPNKGAIPLVVDEALIRLGGAVTAQYAAPGAAPLVIPVEGLAFEYGPLNTVRPVAGRLSFNAVVAGGEVGAVGTVLPRPLRPLESDVDVQLAVSGLDLPPLTPLIGPYVGRAIRSGRLFVAMPVSLKEGRFRATIPVAVEGFAFGDRVDAGGNASGSGGGLLGVPTDLIVAVYKGLDGNLVLPPVSIDYNLLDGSINLGKAISSAFVGMLRGVATQPLRMLGGVAAGGGAVAGQALGGIKDAAGSVTGAAGGIGRGAGQAAGAVTDVVEGVTGGLFRGVGGLVGLGGGGGDEVAAAPEGAVAVAGGEGGEAAAREGVIAGVLFQPGTSVLEPGAAEAMDRFSEILNQRGLGLALTPVIDPDVDGPALLRERAAAAARAAGPDAAPAPAATRGRVTPEMFRNLALRRARTVRLYLKHVAEEELRLPDNAVVLRPEPSESVENPSAAWVRGQPGVNFELIAPRQ